MKINDINQAVYEAKRTLEIADNKASHMASILVGRLRHVNRWDLEKLKKELTNFNAKTGVWK